MKVASKPHAAIPRRNVPAPYPPQPQDHDLPILGVEESPRALLDWEPLLEAGFPPALALGAERRTHGRR